MPNINDYIKYRGDLTLKKDDINEIDKIIFSRISYLPFKDIVFKKIETIEDISYKMKDLSLDKFIWKDDKQFIINLGQTNRYKDLKISDYKESMDIEAEKQFAAITIWLPKKLKYISFRGTDMSLVGWKEDFNMSFMQNIPSQKEAVNYLNEIGKKYRNKLIIGGHSKGGNIAVYASIFCNEKIKRRIIEIINADGPGFDETVTKNEGYMKIMEKVNTYIPQSSIIGRLLEHEDNYEIIYSTQKGIMQHDIYSWQLDGTSLVRIQKLTEDSQLVNKVVRSWLKDTTQEQRENFINIIYDILVSTQVENVNEFGIDTIKKITKIVKSYKDIDKEDKKEIEVMIKLLIKSTINAIKDSRKEVRI